MRAALAPWLAQRRVVQSAGASAAAVVVAPAEDCADGGTRTATFDDRDGNSASSAGDVVTVAFAGCGFDQVVLDGRMVMTITASTAGSSLSGTMRFRQVKVTAGSVKTTIAGAADVTETDDGSRTDTAIVARGDGLSVAVASPSYSDTIALATGFTIATSSSDSADGSTVRVDGAFQASSLATLDGSLHVATVLPVVVTSTSAYPTAGQLRLTDDFGGALLLTMTGAAGVELKLDADGDGTFEGDTTVAWSTLLPH